MTPDPTKFVSTPAPGRDCGTCALCCKVFDVPVLQKPMGRWCQHCTPGKGCGIHETRPDHCRAFHCLWMLEPWLGPEWKPERSKFVITVDPASKFLLIQLDPAQPAAWKAEPYYSQIKRWAAAALENQRQVIVFLNRAMTGVLPDRDVDLGVLAANERIQVKRQHSLIGPQYDVVKQKIPAQG